MAPSNSSTAGPSRIVDLAALAKSAVQPSSLHDLPSDTHDEATEPAELQGSPTLSVGGFSVYSYDSLEDSQFYLRDVHGRTFNSTNTSYALPADAEEHARQDLHHEMLKKQLNGLFLRPEAIRRAMAPRQESQPAALDIGTGSGRWVIDVANLFPHAQIVGMDLAPANLTKTAPPNCRFECDDANLGFGHYKDSFDVVHIRCASMGINDYPAFLYEVLDMLRPDGALEVLGGDVEICDSSCLPITQFTEGEKGFSYFAKLMQTSKAAMRAGGQHFSKCSGVDNIRKAGNLIKSMGDVWSETGYKIIYIPIGPWEEELTEKQRYIAELMRQDAYHISSSYRPLLLNQGFFAETVDRLISQVHDELKNLDQKLYVKWHCAWAVKSS